MPVRIAYGGVDLQNREGGFGFLTACEHHFRNLLQGKTREFLMRRPQQGRGAEAEDQHRDGQNDRGKQETEARQHG